MSEQLAFAESMRTDRKLLRELFKSLQEARLRIKNSEASIAESKALLAEFSASTSLPTLPTTS